MRRHVFGSSDLEYFKVHTFWEGHKILWNLHHRFDRYYIGQIYGGDMYFIMFDWLHEFSRVLFERSASFLSVFFEFKQIFWVFFLLVPPNQKPFWPKCISFSKNLLIEQCIKNQLFNSSSFWHLLTFWAKRILR